MVFLCDRRCVRSVHVWAVLCFNGAALAVVGRFISFSWRGLMVNIFDEGVEVLGPWCDLAPC